MRNNANVWVMVFGAVMLTMVVIVGLGSLGGDVGGVIHLTGQILASDLDSTNVESDNDVPTYDAASGGFTWEPVSILATDLDSTNVESDNDIPTYDAASGGFTWEALPTSGLTEADQWRLTTGFTGIAVPITANWERVDSDGFSVLGSGMSESSGIFTFPTTGYWLITFDVDWHSESGIQSVDTSINTTLNDSSYSKATRGRDSGSYTGALGSPNSKFLFDVTNVTTHKVRFAVDFNGDGTVTGDTEINRTHVTFIRLGDT